MVKKYFCKGPIYWTIVVSFTFAILWLNIAETATYYVAKNGGDSNPGTESQPFLTITKAATVVFPGDTVLVKAGIYEEAVSLTTTGTADARITFKDYGDGEVIISGRIKTVSTGWTLTAGQTNTYEIIDTPAVKGIFEDLSAAPYKGNGVLFAVTGIANVETNEGTFWYDTATTKLYVHVWQNVNPNTRTMHIAYDDGPGFSIGNSIGYITIDGFTIRYRADFGISTSSSTGYGNIVRNCKMYLLPRSGGQQSLYFSFSVSNSKDCIIANNLLYNLHSGIFFYSSGTGNKIYHNTVYQTRGQGIYFNIVNVTMKNNIFYAGGTSGPPLYAQGSIFSSSLNYNIYRRSDSDTFDVFWTDSVTYSSLSTFQSATGQEPNGLGSVDPQFISKTIGSENLDLQSTSPCINAADDGLNLGAYHRPSSPTNITAGKPAGTSKNPTVTISWNPVIRSSNKIDGYNIYKSNNLDTGYTLIGTVTGETTTSYKDSSSLIGNSYYKVRAYKKTSDGIIDIESWYSSSVKVSMLSPRTTVPAGQGTEVRAFFDEKTKIIIPANTIKRELSFTIDRATSLPSSTVETAKVVSGIEFKVEDTKGNSVKELEGLVTIVLHTTSSDGVYVDEIDPKVKKEEVGNKLIIGYWNGLLWIPMTNTSKAWSESNDVYVMAKTSHFSTYGIITKGSSKISEIGIRVFPNPVTPASSDSRFNKVTFVFENNDNESVEIKIWDITGVLVKQLEGMPGITTMEWDGRDEYGDIVEGGVYIWQIKIGNSLAGKGTIIVAK